MFVLKALLRVTLDVYLRVCLEISLPYF